MEIAGKKILLVDDDHLIHDIVRNALESRNVRVFSAFNGQKGLVELYAHKPDLVILDIMMPEMDGWETCRQIRLLSNVPILLLTSLSEEKNVIRGLDSGADDFLGKPFNIDHLLARLRALLRRAGEWQSVQLPQGYRDEHLQIDFDQRKIFVGGQNVDLTRTEYRLLEYLIQHKGRVLDYTQILNNVWGWEYQDSPDYVHVYISHLRKKIEAPLKNVTYFQTVYGIGYQFEKQMT
jgi:DNA-binding response OmpR family regulator